MKDLMADFRQLLKQFVHSNKIVPFHFWRNLRAFCNWLCEKILSVAYSFKDAWKLQKLTRKKKVKLFHKCSPATIRVAFGVKLVLPSNVRNKASWKISNVVVCHICVALIINGNKEALQMLKSTENVNSRRSGPN